MQWIDGRELTENITAETLFEMICSAVSEHPIEKWKAVYTPYSLEHNTDPIYVSLWLLYFDSLLTESDICDCVRNSYIMEIRQSFRIIGDNADAEILEEINNILPPDMILFPGGGYISNFLAEITDKHYAKGRMLAQKLFQKGDIKTLVKSYLKRRLHWKLLDTRFTLDNDENFIIREEEYKDYRISVKLKNDSCFLECFTEGISHKIPCNLDKNSIELFEKIQGELEDFIDSKGTVTEKETFYRNLFSNII